MSGSPNLAEVATVTQRLAVLLAAGVAPASAWGHVAASTDSQIARRVATGVDLAAAAGGTTGLQREAWQGLAAAWSVATECGSPLAPALRDYAVSLRDLGDAQRDAQVALAGPVATARMVMMLPAVGVLFGLALGFNTLGTLVGTPIGWGCLVVGGSLLVLAARWNRRLVAAARPVRATPGLACELTAIGMAGGASLDRTRSIVDSALVQFGIEPEGHVDEVLRLSRAAGVPAAELLRAEAVELRAAARAMARERAAALAVKLMLPLGLCVLPAFLALGVVPLLVTVISSTVRSF
ncbi:MAG: type II secretion system F family protein [Salinibacterium sp.]|nr:type II secretion system F family protein [Salinibacterium sp.]